MAINLTDWSRLCQCNILVDGRQIPIAIYRQQRKFESLSTPAQALLIRLVKGKKQNRVVSLREISKGLAPKSMSKAPTVRALMLELTSMGYIRLCAQRIRYAGYWRGECWEILD